MLPPFRLTSRRPFGRNAMPQGAARLLLSVTARGATAPPAGVCVGETVGMFVDVDEGVLVAAG